MSPHIVLNVKNRSHASSTVQCLTCLITLSFIGLIGCNNAMLPATPSVDSDSGVANELHGDEEASEPWSDPATWGGQVPANGADVTIPTGKSIYLDRDIEVGSLTIPTGSLLACDRGRDLRVSTRWIKVGGRLKCGSAQIAYTHRLDITLTGNPAEDVGGMGTKGILVMGSLELFGERRLSWTQLGKSAMVGTSTLSLKEPVDWRPGDKVVIASSDFEFAQQTEERRITSVSGTDVTLDQPVMVKHFGELQNYPNALVLDERAEVGLLTRNIVVHGDDHSGVTHFGGQIMAMQGASMHISGVEFYNVGQAGKKGRYPIHWHLAGDVNGQFIKNSSIYHSFNRCVTVHGTHRALVQDNVCYDHQNHGIFIEDGIETGNVFDHNLIMASRRAPAGEEVLVSDISLGLAGTGPASFWITNPDNTFTGNAVAGTDGIGFWIGIPLHPMGPSMNPNVSFQSVPVRSFVKNTVHSAIHYGIVMDSAPIWDDPTGKTQPYWYAPTPQASFEKTTVYKVGSSDKLFLEIPYGVAIWSRGANQRFTDLVLADNQHGTFWSSDQEILGGLIIGESGNANSRSRETLGVVSYDGPNSVDGVYFAGFDRTDKQRNGAFGGGGGIATYVVKIKRVGFAPSTRKFLFADVRPSATQESEIYNGGSSAVGFFDVDGSLIGQAGRIVTSAQNTLAVDNTCSNIGDGAYGCPSSILGLRFLQDDSLTLARFQLGMLKMQRIDNGAAYVSSGQWHTSFIGVPNADGYRPWHYFGVPAGQRYLMTATRAMPSKFNLYLGHCLRAGDWVIVSIPWTGGASVSVGQAASLAALQGQAQSGYALEAGQLHIKLYLPTPGVDVSVSVQKI